MKKHLILLTLLLTAFAAQAQQAPATLGVLTKDGATGSHEFEAIQKITFSDGNMVIAMKQGDSSSYAIANISRMYFLPGGGFVSQETVQDFFVWAPLTKELSVRCPAGTAIYVYSPDGRLALTAIQTVAQAPLSLSTLPKGMYVVEAASKTSKIVIR